MRLFPLLLVATACQPEPEGGVREAGKGDTGETGGNGGDNGGDSGGEGDTDTDTDSDTDTDTDTDTDSDTDTDVTDVSGCVATSSNRASCRLKAESDWTSGVADGVDVGATLTLGDDATSGTDTSGDMNGGSYVAGSWTSPVLTPGVTFDGLVPSWNATTPTGTWLRLNVQVRVGGTWSGWYELGVWASTSTVERHSYSRSSDSLGTVYTDTVFTNGDADAARIRVTLYSERSGVTPTVSRLAIAVADTSAGSRSATGGEAWGVTLDVPARSQMVYEAGEVWCSPTSTSMIMAWHSEQAGVSDWNVTVPEAADGTHDTVYDGNGNWPFNVAYAASLGLTGEVGWFDSLADLEPWIAAGVPVALSCAWDPGELDNAPISSTAGHLLVLRGFDENGDALVNDPAASSDGGVPRTYDRAQLEAAWMGGSGGVGYLIWAGG